ncbi:hypothetical protein K437DRAFT_269206, partial [Tilletiaria anomala UBC 951]
MSDSQHISSPLNFPSSSPAKSVRRSQLRAAEAAGPRGNGLSSPLHFPTSSVGDTPRGSARAPRTPASSS